MIERRAFLQTLLGCGLGLFGIGCSARTPGGREAPARVARASGEGAKSRVVVARSPKVFTGEHEVSEPALAELLRAAAEKLSGEPWETFWRERFDRRDTVAIKVSCLAGPLLSTHVALVRLVVRALAQAGVPGEKILVFERSRRELERAGFTAESIAPARCVATDDDGVGYDREPTVAGSIGSRFSRIVSETATALVNMPVLKDHDLAGVTFALKNNLGCIDNPNKCHPDGGDPFIADVNSVPCIRVKTRLVVGDALRASYDGGPCYTPGGVWKPGALVLGEDPVAVDHVGLGLVEMKRKEKKLPSLREESRWPKYLETAASIGLGKLGHAHVDEVSIEL